MTTILGGDVPHKVKQAVVVVKTIWRMYGSEPLTVQMAATPETRQWAWEREAQRFIDMIGMCTQQQIPFTKARFFKEQVRPGEWDEMVGEIPGIDDPILSKEIKWGTKFYQNGPVRTVEVALKKPQV